MTEIISPDNQLVDDGGISTQRTQIWLDQVTDLQIITGTGTPEGIVSANVSRLYLQTDGTDGAVLFIKQLSDIGGNPKYGWVVCGGGGSASIALEDLTDVTITSIATGELLKWNGSAWVNNTLSEAGVQPEEDQRLSTTDSVEFLSVTTGNVIATGNITVTGTVDGRDIAVDGIKLDGIEAGADVTDTDNVVASLTAGANITIAADGTISATSSGGNETLAQTLVLGNTTGGTDISVSTGDNIVVATGSTVDGRDISVDGNKLDGIEDNADVTDTANVTAAGALMDSEVVNLDQVKNFDASDYATAAQGVTADNALPLAGGTMTGVISNFTSTGIDDNATSTQLTITDTEATFEGDVVVNGGNLRTVSSSVATLDTENSATGIASTTEILSVNRNLGRSTTDVERVFSESATYSLDATNGAEDGRVLNKVMSNGTLTQYMRVDSDLGVHWAGIQEFDSSATFGGTATFAGDVIVDTNANAASITINSPSQTWSGGENLGELNWYTEDTSGAGPANIATIKVTSTGSNTLPKAAMVFQTSNANATATTALTLDSSQNATFAGDINFSGASPNILLDVDTDRLVVSGGDDQSSGANIIFYGDNHFSNADKMIFRNSSTTALTINADQSATFAGEIDASAGGIYLGGTAAVNHLDDYEEGTWTPTNYTGNIYNANYIKIGNLVTISVYLQGGAFTTNHIGGLPYSPSTSNRYVAGLIGYTDTTNVTGSYTQPSSRLFFVNKTSAVTPNDDRMMIQVSYFVGI